MKHAERWKLYGRIITNQGGQAISGLVPSRMHTHVFDLVVNAPRIADEHADLLAALKRILDDKKPLEWSQTAEAAESFAAARVLLSDILTKEE